MFKLNEKFSGISKAQLRRRLIILFLLLLIPSTFLIYKAVTQLKWENFAQNRQLAEEFSNRINFNLSRLIETEQQRKFTDYSFLNVSGDNISNVLSRSPLAAFPVKSQIPGLLGYFQIDSEGQFSTTLLPNVATNTALAYGIPEREYSKRKALQNNLFQILNENKLVENKPLIITGAKSNIVLAEESQSTSIAEVAETRRSNKSINEDFQQNYGEADQQLSEFSVANKPLTETENLKDNNGLSRGLVSDSDSNIIIGDESDKPEPEEKFQTPALTLEEGEQLPSTPKKVPVKSLPESQRAFDKLLSFKKSSSKSTNTKLGSVDELSLDDNLAKQSPMKTGRLNSSQDVSKKKEVARLKQRKSKKKHDADYESADEITVTGSRIRTETNLLPETKLASSSGKLDLKNTNETDYRVKMFQSEIDLFEISLLENGYFVLFRKVWKEGNRYIQGALIEAAPFLDNLVEVEYRNTSLAELANLAVAYDKEVLSLYASSVSGGYFTSSRDVKGFLLYQNRFQAPFSELEFIFSVEKVALASGNSLVLWISLIIILVLCLGFYFIYHLGLKQIELLAQQQDFVSSVSHELKTPLTSIRMYGEMLREGWVTEDKKLEYYDYIHDESERLSRLINNVLQLSKLSRDDLQIQLRSYSVSELMDHIQSKITSQLEAAGYQLKLDCDKNLQESRLKLDMDAFTQIIINLVDNAIKFSTQEEAKQIDISCQLKRNNMVQFSVRDYGRGIDKAQFKKIFKLFYRVENELTRETMGTGIGLALVNTLVLAMGGEVDVVNCSPGAEFRVSFPIEKKSSKLIR